MTPEQLIAYDKDHIWHPYTSMQRPIPAYAVASASGVEITLETGEVLVDGTSSWWTALHGYNHPALNAAATEQLGKMSHIMFGGLTHAPAVNLAKQLIDMTADNLQHVFFADSGSVGVEVSIKMALQYWIAQGRSEKHKLLTVRSGYHGDTFAAMSVCDPVNGMHDMFTGVLVKHLFAEAPPIHKAGDDWNPSDINSFKAMITQHHAEVAAVILEPIVQNAGGIRFYHPEYLRQVRALCDEFDVLLILDEIATGFGRTGKMFAYEHADIQPDILVLGKALTGGYMTLSAVLTSREVAHGIGSDGQGVLMHGPTFMANPLACAVSVKSIELLLASNWQTRVSNIEQQMTAELEPCRSLSIVADVRTKGAIGVVELKEPVDSFWIQPRLVELGVWIRPFGKLVYIMPPFIIEPTELSKLTAAICTVVSEMNAH
ncbi:adenosylmethionine--8-amino-7-oxononanoate transaminase [Leucothrix arctica]|uniref:Adenosylmethionine-8-amino-7-oxononanoate aminotransferase n=1 Tax=Leucothrix arctica TaxID=1481894 RepID=A0A317C9A7_9GAMM|nr:adenosylmethionine--8-amino-7-oxononanoate transaminase [Leucothrix arctica]PWQ94761.1 adenosylmethionine--8-amino-7-oxononanoate transaminase [Leucothrix arctica]